MQDLIDKIENLRKAILSVSSKASSLVPAIKTPTLKPLSMPAASSGAKATKIPGVAPPSNKDPKAMAAQLYNPKPKKPKIEVLKVDSNGQWKLDNSV